MPTFTVRIIVGWIVFWSHQSPSLYSGSSTSSISMCVL